MPQFALHRNRNTATRARFPLLLDIQSDLLEPLATRVVVPLSRAAARSKAMQGLMPVLRFGNKDYVMLTPQLAGVSVRELGPAVGELGSERQVILAALDFLITGI